MSFTLVTTADGSVSCLDSETGEWCHNRAGAYTEALKNYIEPSGLVDIVARQGQARILDACYGLGYNTWVLIDVLLKTQERPFALTVVAIEKNPEILSFLPQVLAHPTFDALKSKTSLSEHNIYYRTQLCPMDTKGGVKMSEPFVIDVADGSRIEIEFLIGDLREQVKTLDGPFDAIFHDPFSPQKMPELWTMNLFQHYSRLLAAQQGRLLTYSAAAAVRGGLMEAGFTLGRTAALGAKSGGTIAATVDEAIGIPLTGEECAYIQTRAGIPYRDAGLCTPRADILAARKLEQAQSGRPSGNSGRKLLQV